MLVTHALVGHFLHPFDGFGFTAGLLAGAAYVGLHRKRMPEADKFRILFIFIAVAALSSFLTGTRHIGEFSAEFSMLVSGLLALAYSLCAYLGLSIGSFACARLKGYAPKGRGIISSMKNSYVLGFLIILGETAVNLAYSALTGHPRAASGIGIVMAMVAGSMYAIWHKEKMPPKERFKAIGVYMGIVLVIGVVSLWERLQENFGLFALIGVVFILIYAAIMYSTMGWGSSIQLKAIEKQAAKSAQA